MTFVVAVALMTGLALPGAAFADETPPPADGGGEPAGPGTPTGTTGTGDVTDLPALPAGGLPPLEPSVPVGESWPIGPFPGTAIGDSSTAPNAAGPWPLLLSPEALSARDALRAQLAAKYGSVEAGASAEGIDPATLEVSGSAAEPSAALRAAENFRIALALHLLVPKAWSSWTGNATTLWIM
jgi:hypothetical protein